MKNRQKILLPSMGESITEATLLGYTKQVGDKIEEDEIIAEVATDKVDSEIPSPFSGIITELFFRKDDIIQIGQAIAAIDFPGNNNINSKIYPSNKEVIQPAIITSENHTTAIDTNSPNVIVAETTSTSSPTVSSAVKYSPLVKTMCRKENIELEELIKVKGTGKNGKITKRDIVAYIARRKTSKGKKIEVNASTLVQSSNEIMRMPPSIQTGNHQIIEMDRMRKMIADHMVMSKQTSPHVSTFLEVDVTNIVNWRNKNKQSFMAAHGEKLTYTPIFFEAIAKAIKDFPTINVSTSENKIYVKKAINLGMATALPSGSLIVPVIKNSDKLNLVGLTAEVNRLAKAARANRLSPSDVKDGTFTISNIGTFGNDAGTPIINQPQAAILALGAINKKPAVVTTCIGDVIAIRHLMILSISFDHRIIDGFLGGSFLRRVGDYLEGFDKKAI